MFFFVISKLSHHTRGGGRGGDGTGQCNQMTDGGGRGLKSVKIVLRIIWIAPKGRNQNKPNQFSIPALPGLS